MDYKVDLRDIKFQLFEWLGLGKMLEAEKFADWDAENVEMVLDEALKIGDLGLPETVSSNLDDDVAVALVAETRTARSEKSEGEDGEGEGEGEAGGEGEGKPEENAG